MDKFNIKSDVRLLKMLGEDLITDEKTALIELIKNSYDADATWVKVDFRNFGEDFSIKSNSQIVIEDNGDGMTKSTIINHWLSPGTSNKKVKKNLSRTKRGRVLQGEKGIGRFAMLKLGRNIELHTRHEDESHENWAYLDLSFYNDDFITDSDSQYVHYLEDLEVKISEVSTPTLENVYGTRLIISNLNGIWTNKKVREVYFDIAALQSISPIIEGWKKGVKLEDFNKGAREFTICFTKDGNETSHKKDYEKNLVDLLNLIKDKSFLEVRKGYFNDKEKSFSYIINDVPASIKITDPEMASLSVYKRYFVEERPDFENEVLSCGPFEFEFYVFFIDKKSYKKFESEKYQINDEEKAILKKHRIYLYRDDIRVYPYGEPKNDWLQTDNLRAWYAANATLSNDQVVGLIKISYSQNPNLQDKTNREGLISKDEADKEIVALLQTFLSYLRMKKFDVLFKKLINDYDNKIKRKADEERRKKEEEQKRLEEERLKEQQLQEELRNKDEEERKKVKQGDHIKEEPKKGEEKHEEPVADEQEKEPQEPAKPALVDMERKNKNMFFKYSDILKSSVEKSPFYISHNVLIEQLSTLKYEKHYLLFALSFRVLVENAAKNYLVKCAKLDVRGAIGENVDIMIEHMLKVTAEFTREQQNDIYNMFGGRNPFKNRMTVIREEFYKKGQQQPTADRLNSLNHTPTWVNEDAALHIANNIILPLIVVSEKIMEFKSIT